MSFLLSNSQISRFFQNGEIENYTRYYESVLPITFILAWRGFGIQIYVSIYNKIISFIAERNCHFVLFLYYLFKSCDVKKEVEMKKIARFHVFSSFL